MDFILNPIVECERHGELIIRSTSGQTMTRCTEATFADHHRMLLDEIEQLRAALPKPRARTGLERM